MDDVRDELRARGARRAQLLKEASEELDAIAELVPAALADGMTKVQLAELASISRPTLDALLRGGRPR